MDVALGQRGGIGLHGAAGHEAPGQDVTLALELSALLNNHFPNHQWMVHVNSQGGVIDIKNGTISGQYGYRIKPGKLTHDALKHAVIIGGGEILERANVRRGRFDEAEMLDVDKIDGVKPQHQPGFIKAVRKYRGLLNGATES